MTAVELSNGLADAVAAAATRVVRVEGRRRAHASGLAWQAGTVVTASHVVSSRRPSRIGWPDGTVTEATVVGRDPATDIAVLSAEGGPSLVPPPEATARVGQLALAVARPSDAVRASLGAITASEGSWRTPYGSEVAAYLEAGLTMYPGFSGGALVDAGGAQLGMLTSALLPGHAIALPVSTLNAVATALAAHGRIRRGYLGVGVQPAELPSGMAASLGRSLGLLVASVEPGSPAADGGVLVGDLLLELDGESLASLDDLLIALSGDRVDRAVSLKLVRGGEPRSVDVRLRERPQPGEQ
jgi:S1-C subfamily serine protease